MLVVSRFRVPEGEAEEFRERLEAAHALLAARPGYAEGEVGRNLDDPELWALVTRWESVGAYRRALSAYGVKVGAVPLLSNAIDEPSAYEAVLPGVGLDQLDRRTGDAGRSLG
ncbi:antibiotic biosynthesis monooxygenase [Nocardioides sp.]|uniref:antibiotic biosynthesis monooxygenase family protein n=1 Tax=Nocardioides sp. TaxID=35761 RepID=UPI0027334658|nr:antibiotic biosynthesis monooxygenase family protein [Nocardioides sp.]MDP3893951.1 antibiotic biosynthesis monooxygenase family protein [Nocardioides sp.]